MTHLPAVDTTQEEVEAHRRPVADVWAEARSLVGKRVEVHIVLYRWDPEASTKEEPFVSVPEIHTYVGALDGIEPHEAMRKITGQHGEHDWIAVCVDQEFVTFLDEVTWFEEVEGD